MRDCGFSNPPPEGSRDREIIDRFADFLTARGAVSARVDAGMYDPGELLPAWKRYELRFLAWRTGHIIDFDAVDLDEFDLLDLAADDEYRARRPTEVVEGAARYL